MGCSKISKKKNLNRFKALCLAGAEGFELSTKVLETHHSSVYMP